MRLGIFRFGVSVMKAQMFKSTAVLLAFVICTSPFAYADVGWARVERKEDAGYVEKAKSWFSSKVKALVGTPAQPIVYTTPATTTTTAQTAPATTNRTPGSTATIESTTSNETAVRDLPRTSTGVAVYKIANVDSVPLLDIGKEARVSSKHYAIGGQGGALLGKLVTAPLQTPEVLTPIQLMALTKIGPRPSKVVNVKLVTFTGKGPVNRTGVDRILLKLNPENKITLAKYTPLTPDEYRYLSGLLLYQQGDKCAVAVGLFHELAKIPKYEAEGNYYLAMCSKKLGLVTDFIERARRVVATQDAHYTNKILPEVSPDLPYEFIEPFGEAVLKAATAKKVLNHANANVAGNVNYIVANFGAQTANWKIAQTYAAQIPEAHTKWPQAQFILALAEYQTGSKTKALAMQEELVKKLDLDKTRMEFQGLVSLNLARMYFQEQKFKESREWFQRIYKDHPLWLQGLQEMGWSQLQSGDYEGAIGNMYSVQSPYFSAVYKPESYVIRTIGYLNLCQYGDAYRTLTALEKTYRPWQKKMDFYQKVNPDFLTTVRKFLALKSASAEIDGLPSQVVREMVRHRDYTALQKSLNRQLEEQAAYASLDKEVDKSLARSRWLVNNSRKRAEQLRQQISSIKKNPQLEQNRLQWKQELDNELVLLNSYFFQVDLFDEAKVSLQSYKFEVIAGAEKRLTKMRNRITTLLAQRLERMRSDLKVMLDNNELLRYEAFSGSGENIRYQVAGGEKGKRVPAEIIPQSKSLQWDFAGEYWEDEIGNYRSSLKNNCPDTKTAGL
jgi:hypothetical protein